MRAAPSFPVLMALSEHLFCEISAGLEKISDDKKGGRSIVFFQRTQNLRHIAVFVFGVKGQIENFIFCGVDVGGSIFFQ